MHSKHSRNVLRNTLCTTVVVDKKQQTYVQVVAQPTVRLEQSGAALKQKSGIVAKEWSRFLPPQAAALMLVANIISSNQTIVM